jgi:hypothetical protein
MAIDERNPAVVADARCVVCSTPTTLVVGNVPCCDKHFAEARAVDNIREGEAAEKVAQEYAARVKENIAETAAIFRAVAVKARAAADEAEAAAKQAEADADAAEKAAAAETVVGVKQADIAGTGA